MASAIVSVGFLFCAVALISKLVGDGRSDEGMILDMGGRLSRLFATHGEAHDEANKTDVNNHDFVPANPAPPISPLVARGLVLLTSVFVPLSQASDHLDEIYAALATNILNKFIVEVHVLTESDCFLVKHRLAQQVAKMPRGPAIKENIDSKLTCNSTTHGGQPSYADFFRYANATLAEKMVLLSSADVVFDETLGLIDPHPVMQHELAYILSVMSPPHNGQYKKVFNRECDTSPRCAVGAWQGGGAWGQGPGGGNSWDSYVFAPPFSPRMDLSHVDHPLTFPGAKNLAAFQLEVYGNLTLYNPCFHVHAYHWHCRGSKMHDEDPTERADRPHWYTEMMKQPSHTPWNAVEKIFPCWHCPGVDMPTNAARRSDYCRKGHLLEAKDVPELGNNFRIPWISGGICCSNLDICDKLLVQSLPHCLKAADVDCVTWEFTAEHVYY
jgi:hypothetical protein